MIETVSVKDWKSHRETSVELEDGVNTFVGTLGSGKSSMLEALTFGLFGTTPAANSHEVKLDQLIRRGQEQSRVEVEFSSGPKEYRVVREIEQGKGSKLAELYEAGDLIAEGPREVTREVEDILGTDFNSFTTVLYIEQNSMDEILEMRPSERKEWIDGLLELEKFEEARGNGVKLRNKLESQAENLREQLEEFDDEEIEEVEELREKLNELKEKQEKLKEELEEKKEGLEEKKEGLEELERKKKRHEELEKKRTEKKSRLETLNEQLDEELEEPELAREDAEEELKTQEELEESIEETEEELEDVQDSIEDLEEDIERLEEEKQKYSKLEGFEEDIEDIEKSIEELKESRAGLKAEKEQNLKAVDDLGNAGAECPTCGQPLDEAHRERELEEKKARNSEIDRELEEKKAELEDLLEQKDEFGEKRDELLKYSDSGDKLEEAREKIEGFYKEFQEKKEKLEDLREEYSAEKMEELEDIIGTYDKLEKQEETVEKIDDTTEDIEAIDERLEELTFDPERLEALREEVQDIEKSIELGRSRLKSRKELMKERAQRLNVMEERLAKRQSLEEELEATSASLTRIDEFMAALKDTQVYLRQLFIRKLNDLLARYWAKAYPYEDYSMLRLTREYQLELKDGDGNWVNANSEVSGGERHTAALIMRIALSSALQSELDILILDEPTHNLDDEAVNRLSELLSGRASNLVEQLVVVTHDKALESSATGKLYSFSKKGSTDEVSTVSEL